VDPPFRVRAAITPPRCSPGGVLFGLAQRDQAARLGQQD